MTLTTHDFPYPRSVQALHSEVAAQRISMPDIEHLRTNYRTHSGILDVAASIVDLLRKFFPNQLDKLERERAFFVGPPPLLLSAISSDDLTILLSGSDRKSSQAGVLAHACLQLSQSPLNKLVKRKKHNLLTPTLVIMQMPRLLCSTSSKPMKHCLDSSYTTHAKLCVRLQVEAGIHKVAVPCTSSLVNIWEISVV